MYILAFSGHSFVRQQLENDFGLKLLVTFKTMFIAVSEKNEFASICAVVSPRGLNEF